MVVLRPPVTGVSLFGGSKLQLESGLKNHFFPATNQLIPALNNKRTPVRRQKGDRLKNKNCLSPPFVILFNSDDILPYGAVTVFAINVTAVCANALPLSFAPVFIEISV